MTTGVNLVVHTVASGVNVHKLLEKGNLRDFKVEPGITQMIESSYGTTYSRLVQPASSESQEHILRVRRMWAWRVTTTSLPHAHVSRIILKWAL